MSTSPHLHARIAAVLNGRFPNNKIALSHFGQLLIEYVEAYPSGGRRGIAVFPDGPISSSLTGSVTS